MSRSKGTLIRDGSGGNASAWNKGNVALLNLNVTEALDMGPRRGAAQKSTGAAAASQYTRKSDMTPDDKAIGSGPNTVLTEFALPRPSEIRTQIPILAVSFGQTTRARQSKTRRKRARTASRAEGHMVPDGSLYTTRAKAGLALAITSTGASRTISSHMVEKGAKGGADIAKQQQQPQLARRRTGYWTPKKGLGGKSLMTLWGHGIGIGSIRAGK
jgi:hypothetical protein